LANGSWQTGSRASVSSAGSVTGTIATSAGSAGGLELIQVQSGIWNLESEI